MFPGDIFFGILISFLAGVLSASAGWNFLVSFAVACALIFGLLFVRKYPKTFAFFFLGAFFVGAFYYNLFLNLRENSRSFPLNQETVFSGKITGEPKFGENNQRVLLGLEQKFSGDVTVFLPRFPEYQYGDVLTIRGQIEKSDGFRDPVSFFPEVIAYQSSEHQLSGLRLVKGNLLALKHIFINQFRTVLPSDSAALMSGLTFGSQADFTKEFKDRMALSGTTHLVALSGYNIAILVLLVAAFLGRFFSRRVTFYATVVLIFLFVLMVGAEASVVRAAIMGFLALFARETGRMYSFRNAVTLAAVTMVVFDPTILVFDLGFQFSFLSLLGIVYLGPAIKKYLERFSRAERGGRGKARAEEGVLGWRENAITTLSAQLAVAPLLIAHFNEVSLTSIVANVLILELVPLTMAFGFLLAGITFVFGYLGAILAWFVNIFLVYQITVINIFSKIRIPIGGDFIPQFLFVAYYFALIGFVVQQSRFLWRREPAPGVAYEEKQ